MSSTSALDRVFVRCRDLGIRREPGGRWVAGVCVGLARRWHVDPVLVRVAFLLLTFFGGVGIPVYLLCWLLLPAADSSIALERALRHGDGSAITILVFAAITTVGVLLPTGDGSGASLLGLLVLAGVLWWLVRSGRLQPATPAGATGGAAGGAGAATTSDEAPTAAPDAGSPPDEADLRPVTAAPALPADRPSTGSTAATPSDTEVTHWASVPAHDRVDDSGSPVAAHRSDTGMQAPMRVIEPGAGGPVGGPTRRASAAPITAPPDAPDTAPAPDRRARRGAAWPAAFAVTGLAIVASGTVAGLSADVAVRPWLAGLAVGLAVIGMALIVSGLLGRRLPLLTPIAWVLGVSLVASTLSSSSADIGDRHWRPLSPAEIQSSYALGIGDATLDLTAVTPDGTEPIEIEVDQGIGDLLVVLPGGVSATVEVDTGIGDVHVEEPGVPARTVATGLGADETLVIGDGAGDPVYLFDVSGGIGDATFRITDTRPADAGGGTGASNTDDANHTDVAQNARTNGATAPYPAQTTAASSALPASMTRVLEEIR